MFFYFRDTLELESKQKEMESLKRDFTDKVSAHSQRYITASSIDLQRNFAVNTHDVHGNRTVEEHHLRPPCCT